MPNNDDCGQMSAWYIFSALGFYPVTPADTIYLFGSPSVSSAQVRLPGGRVFIIETENLSDNNIYIESVVLNGKEKRQNYITHSEIMNGGDLVFRMGPEPNRSWGVEKEERPV